MSVDDPGTHSLILEENSEQFLQFIHDVAAASGEYVPKGHTVQSSNILAL
jgi:hypothetical protein